MRGTDVARRADDSRKSQALVRSSPRPWLRRSATGAPSARGAILPLGSVWCPSSTRPAARNGSAALPSRAIAICNGCSSPAPWRSFATQDSTAPSELGITRIMDRRPTKVAAVALANEIARMAWAIMVHGERYREPKLNAGYAMPVLEAQEAKAAAQALGLEAARLQIWQSEDIAPAIEGREAR